MPGNDNTLATEGNGIPWCGKSLRAIVGGAAALLFFAAGLQAETGGGSPSLADPAADAQPVALAKSGDGPCTDEPCLGQWGHADGCGCCSLPCWTVDANALFLTRRVSSAPLITDFASGAELLSASTTDLSSHPGVDIGLTRHWDCGNALEVRYAGVDRWNAQALIPTNAGDPLQINAGIPLFIAAGTAIDAHYASQWHSFEFNGRHELCQQRLTLLAGFRYVELDEDWGFTLVDTAPAAASETATRNRLYGFQLGGQAVLWDRGGRLSLDAVGKAGIYGNCAAQDSLNVAARISQQRMTGRRRRFWASWD